MHKHGINASRRNIEMAARLQASFFGYKVPAEATHWTAAKLYYWSEKKFGEQSKARRKAYIKAIKRGNLRKWTRPNFFMRLRRTFSNIWSAVFARDK